jgi:uncharacterized iron-regulated membrane protein
MDSGLFEIEFGSPLTAGLGSSAIYVDAITGVVAGQVVPGAGTAGDAVMQLRYPLHTGRIAGMAGRMLIGITGLAVVLVSVTGVMLWWKKKRLRCRIAKRV